MQRRWPRGSPTSRAACSGGAGRRSRRRARPRCAAVLELVDRAAQADAPVLFRGESGTGKGVLARAMHLESPRRERPFVTVNCPTLTEELLASELFGHAKGAFTGAVRDQPGRVEAAEGGTLFLDEIGEMPAGLQAKLLRFLQDKQFERVGETRTRQADVRVVAATNRDLEADVRGRTLPRGPALSPERHRGPRAAAARAARGHPAAGAPLPGLLRARGGPPAARALADAEAALRALPVARQRPRAAQRHRARASSCGRRRSSSRRRSRSASRAARSAAPTSAVRSRSRSWRRLTSPRPGARQDPGGSRARAGHRRSTLWRKRKRSGS